MAPVDLLLQAPLTGPLVELADVPDPVFSAQLLGPGLAIEPLDGRLQAPCAGSVVQLARTHHALTLRSDCGVEILLHLGLDSVALAGQGFVPRVREGDRVEAGQLLLEFDLDRVARGARSLVSMLTLGNAAELCLERLSDGYVTLGEPLLRLQGMPAPAAATEGAGTILRGEAVINHAGGLHARPAAQVRQAVLPFAAKVRLCLGEREAEATSLTALLTLGAGQGARVSLTARGPEAAAALAAVIEILQRHDAAEPAPRALQPPRAQAGPGRLVGSIAAPGLAAGPLYRLTAELPPATTAARGNAGEEQSRLARARAQVAEHLRAQARAQRQQGRESAAAICEAHLALLDDEALLDASRALIVGGMAADQAWRTALDAQCQRLEALDNPLLRERAGDLRDLQRQVWCALNGAMTPRLPPPGAVLVASDLLPSEFLALQAARLAGLCLARGGATSHVALLARAAGLPCLVALGDEALQVPDGQAVVLDAEAGVLEIAPDPARIAAVQQLQLQQAKAREALREAARQPAQTRDGVKLEVAANAAHLGDAEAAAREGADGIGLLRTELLFMDRDQPPGEAEQLEGYSAILAALPERPVIIRSLDIGGDKPVAYLPLPVEANPALGLRGIRLGWTRPELLDVQLRALLRIPQRERCRLLLPMVNEVEELLAVRTRLAELAEELGVSPALEVGVMIETPAAALLANQLAEHAEFFSIGTNDLTQYTLAMDRGHSQLSARCDALHPSLLRLIAQTCAGARRHGRWVGICGALAADPLATPVLIGLGIRELSVGAAQVGALKARVRGLDARHCQEAVAALLDLRSAAEVRARSRALWPLDEAAPAIA